MAIAIIPNTIRPRIEKFGVSGLAMPQPSARSGPSCYSQLGNRDESDACMFVLFSCQLTLALENEDETPQQP